MAAFQRNLRNSKLAKHIPNTMNQVFLSYRHENEAHSKLVRNLAEKLRAEGHLVALDQFLKDKHAGGPDDGWRKWSERCAEKSSCVLIICSKGWFDSYRGEGPDNA